MITIPTTLVLGAGASHPYGFPIGSALVQQILNPTDQDRLQLQELGITDATIQEFIKELRTAEPPSIDFFLEHRPEFVDIGRLRIGQQLIKCEIADKLNSYDPPLHWYRYFIDKITTYPENILENKVKIVTFNYDRSFETYLYQTLKSRHGREMIDAIESLQINHVHGKLADLPWESGTSTKRDYSQNCSIEDLKNSAEGLKIIFEVDGGSPEFLAAKDTIARSERVYFLGFGYHAESLQRLGFPLSQFTSSKIYGSTLGFYGSEITAINKRIGVHPEVSPYSALEFLRSCKDQLDS